MGLGAASILQCGYAECRPSWWNQKDWHLEPFAKLYAVVAGDAIYRNEDGATRLHAGQVYFFPPHKRARNETRKAFDVHWMHIGIDAPLLDQRFARLRQVESWPIAAWSAWEPVYTRLREFAERRGDELELRLQALAHAAFAEVCARHPEADDPKAAARRDRLAPALRLMDAEFRRNPPLAELAASARLSPAHFHRAFAAAFAITPHAYLLRRRMEAARELLARTATPVREIAAACGYDDQFYFSRAFRRWAGLSPEKYRAARAAGP